MATKYWTRTEQSVLWLPPNTEPPGGKGVICQDTAAQSVNDTVLRMLYDIQLVVQTFDGTASGFGPSWWLGQTWTVLGSVNAGSADTAVFPYGPPDPRVVSTTALVQTGHDHDLVQKVECGSFGTIEPVDTKGQRKSPTAGVRPTPTISLWNIPLIPMGLGHAGWQIIVHTWLRVLYEAH